MLISWRAISCLGSSGCSSHQFASDSPAPTNACANASLVTARRAAARPLAQRHDLRGDGAALRARLAVQHPPPDAVFVDVGQEREDAGMEALLGRRVGVAGVDHELHELVAGALDVGGVQTPPWSRSSCRASAWRSRPPQRSRPSRHGESRPRRMSRPRRRASPPRARRVASSGAGRCARGVPLAVAYCEISYY